MKFCGARGKQAQIVSFQPRDPHLIWDREANSGWAPTPTELTLSVVLRSLPTQCPQLGQLDMKLTTPAPQPPSPAGSSHPLTRARGAAPTLGHELAALVPGFRAPPRRPGREPSLGSVGLLRTDRGLEPGRAASSAPAQALCPALPGALTGAGISRKEPAPNL